MLLGSPPVAPSQYAHGCSGNYCSALAIAWWPGTRLCHVDTGVFLPAQFASASEKPSGSLVFRFIRHGLQRAGDNFKRRPYAGSRSSPRFGAIALQLDSTRFWPSFHNSGRSSRAELLQHWRRIRAQWRSTVVCRSVGCGSVDKRTKASAATHMRTMSIRSNREFISELARRISNHQKHRSLTAEQPDSARPQRRGSSDLPICRRP